MNIVVIGTGYVGLVTAACLAECGHQVNCIDIDKEKLKKLKRGDIPFYEKGLKNIVLKAVKNKTLSFSKNYNQSLNQVEAIFLCVGTPPKVNGKPNLSYLKNSLTSIAENLENDVAIFVKSTVPVGTNKFAKEFIQKKIKKDLKISFASNPEFLKEGNAVSDFKKPDRIIIGTDDPLVKKVSKEIYKNIATSKKLIFTSIESAEIIKYASNAFLATKIAFINEISRLSDHFNADIKEIKKGMSMDERIGEHFLNSGLGFGGSCFPKDLDGLANRFREFGIPSSIPNAVRLSNNQQINYFSKKITGNLIGKTSCVMVWGLAFKGGTDDVRESPSIKLIKKISNKYKEIYAYDPLAIFNAKKELVGFSNIKFIKDKYEFIKKCDCLIIATEHSEFKSVDFKKIGKMKNKLIFDGRNILNKQQAEKHGFIYHGIGV